jgi:hypothetical protein
MIAKPAAMPLIWGAKTDRMPAPTVHSNSGHRRLAIVRAGCSSGSECCTRAIASRRAICVVASSRPPSTIPITTASAHHARQT